MVLQLNVYFPIGGINARSLHPERYDKEVSESLQKDHESLELKLGG